MTRYRIALVVALFVLSLLVWTPGQAQNWSPHSKPFDLVWDMDNEDFNGLPLNPVWAWQLNDKNNFDAVPDFTPLCSYLKYIH